MKFLSFRLLPLQLALAFTAVPIAHAQLPGHKAQPQPAAAASTNIYEFRPLHNPDGIGKFYMGREIAAVMGHEAAGWLERPEREQQEHSEQLVRELQIKPGQVVADLGAGTGYYTRRLARQVGPGGEVLAVDIQPEMLFILTNSAARLGLTNITAIQGAPMDPRLPPRSVDLVLMVDVYHEFDFPFEMVQRICQALRPGGRVVFVEYRAEDSWVPIKPLHKMSEAQVRKEMTVQPLDWLETRRTLPWQHILIFKLRGPAAT